MHNFFHLFRKEMIDNRRYILFVIAYVIMFSFAFPESVMLQGLVPAMLIVIAGGTWTYQVSLPISRRLIVTSKYLSSMFLILVGNLIVIVCSIGTTFIIGIKWDIDWFVTIGGMILLLLVILVYLPISYWLDQVGAKYINVIMMFLTTAIIAFMSNYLRENRNLDWLEWAEAHHIILAFILVCVLAICCSISYSMSVSIFNKKDL